MHDLWLRFDTSVFVTDNSATTPIAPAACQRKSNRQASASCDRLVCPQQEAGHRCHTARLEAAPELAAVIHAGGVLADAALANQSPSSLRDAAAAKGVAVAKNAGRLRSHPLSTQVSIQLHTAGHHFTLLVDSL